MCWSGQELAFLRRVWSRLWAQRKYRYQVHRHLWAYTSRFCTPTPYRAVACFYWYEESQTLDVNCGTFFRYPVQANPLDDLRQGAELSDDSAPLQQRHTHVERLQRPHGNVHKNEIWINRDVVIKHLKSNHTSFSFMNVKKCRIQDRNINFENVCTLKRYFSIKSLIFRLKSRLF